MDPGQSLTAQWRLPDMMPKMRLALIWGTRWRWTRAFLTLYEVTAQRRWLSIRKRAFQFHDQKHLLAIRDSLPPRRIRKACFRRARNTMRMWRWGGWGNLLFHYTGNADYRTAAENALRWIAAPEIGGKRLFPMWAVFCWRMRN